MKENRIFEEGRFSQYARGLGIVTAEMIRERARQLAEISGRRPGQIFDSDLEQARRELTGDERLFPPATAAEELPEESRWEEVPESAGHQMPTLSAADEQTFAEELVEEGMEDAEQDQMIEAVRESRRRDN